MPDEVNSVGSYNSTQKPNKRLNFQLLSIVLLAVFGLIILIALVVFRNFLSEKTVPKIINVENKEATKSSSLQEKPDSQKNKIAFMKNNQEIWLADLDGKNQEKLTTGFNIQWCPDATKLSFNRYKSPQARLFPTAFAEGGAPEENFYYDFKDKKVIQLTKTNSISMVGDGRVSWASDCRRYAYVKADTDELLVGDSETGIAKQIFKGISNADPKWEPNGERILLTTTTDNPSLKIIVINNDGTNKKEIGLPDLGLNSTFLRSVVWAGQGEILIETQESPLGASKLATAVYLVPLSNIKMLTKLASSSDTNYYYDFPYLSEQSKAIVSPDGKYVALYKVENSSSTISIFDMSGKSVLNNVVSGSISWASSSNKFLISDSGNIWLISLEGNKTQIISGGASGAVFSPL